MEEQSLYSVCSCNKLFSEKTLHPLISVIDLSKDCKETLLHTDNYAVMLRHLSSEDFSYGRTKYDFSTSTLLFRGPGKEIQILSKKNQSGSSQDICQKVSTDLDKKSKQNKDLLLIFNTRLLCGTTLYQKLKDYKFFHYKPEEALHLSQEETGHIFRIMNDIEQELEWGVDRFSALILSNKIEMMLNYCCRYYERQFITRHDTCTLLANKAKVLIDEFLLDGKYEPCSAPSACRFAAQLHLSSAYFNDLLKYKTGKDFNEYLQLRRIDIAKQLLLKDKPDREIALQLGFCTPQYFRQIFQKITGNSTEEYKRI